MLDLHAPKLGVDAAVPAPPVAAPKPKAGAAGAADAAEAGAAPKAAPAAALAAGAAEADWPKAPERLKAGAPAGLHRLCNVPLPVQHGGSHGGRAVSVLRATDPCDRDS